jgi:hypothetical protein
VISDKTITNRRLYSQQHGKAIAICPSEKLYTSLVEEIYNLGIPFSN